MMVPHDPLTWLLAGLAGLGLGLFFFGGLWWTVQRSLASRRSLLWHFGGSLLRMGVALSGFYAVGGGNWQRLLACLAGFVLARLLVVRISRRGPCAPAASAASASEGHHAPQS